MKVVPIAAIAALAAALCVSLAMLHDASAGNPWKKPFSKGGALSINKPFSKGGALSIHKVYVPTKLRIGKVETLQEVITPVCWGRPQDCRAPVEGPVSWNEKQYPYFVVARFTCLDRRTNKRTGALCDLTTRSAQSCDEALGALDVLVEELYEEGYDPCSKCLETRNPTLYWDGQSPQHIQDGPCRGR